MTRIASVVAGLAVVVLMTCPASATVITGEVSGDSACDFQQVVAQHPEWNPAVDRMPAWLETILTEELGWVAFYNPNAGQESGLATNESTIIHTISVVATNTTQVAWTDFHFGVLPHPIDGGDMSNLEIVTTAPVPSMTGLGPDYDSPWAVDDVTIDQNLGDSLAGPAIDYLFGGYNSGKPVQPGQTVLFSFELENPDDQPFKLNFYPTTSVVPEPATMSLLALSLAGLVMRRRK